MPPAPKSTCATTSLSRWLVLLVALFLRVTPIEFALLALSILFVLCAELLNTAVEAVVDLVSPGFHPLAKIAKDTAAGAVLVAACGAAIMGYLILAKYILPLYGKVLAMLGTQSDLGTVVAVLIVTIVVIMIKSLSGTGSPLHGGIPSGHAAVAFSIATAVSLNTGDPLISLLCHCAGDHGQPFAPADEDSHHARGRYSGHWSVQASPYSCCWCSKVLDSSYSADVLFVLKITYNTREDEHLGRRRQ